MPFFSVVIPVYNRAAEIRETLDSILSSRFTDFEVLVVDDGSTDDTLDVVATYSDRVRLLKQKNQGPCAARNLGLGHAQGEYCAFLDSDDIWFPWSLELYAEAIRQNGNPALVIGERVDFATASELDIVREEPLRTKAFRDYLAASAESPFISASALVVRTDALRRVGGFHKEWINAEDCDLCLRLGTESGYVYIAAPAQFGYRKHAGSLVGNLGRAVAGQRHLISQEKTGGYPGGSDRRRERLEILTRHVRPAALEFLRRGAVKPGLELYLATLPWHLALGRFRFLAAFPLLALKNLVAKG